MTKSTSTKGKATALDQTVSVQLSALTLDNARLQQENTALTDENTQLKAMNVQLASVIETDLKADLKLKILAKSDFKDTDLEPLKVEQLQQIDETLSKSKGVGDAVYKPIRTSGDTSHGRATVGNLFGKTRKEILEMGGVF